MHTYILQEKLIKTQMNDLFLKLQQDFAEQTRNAAQLMQDKEDEWRARDTDLKDQIDANERRCVCTVHAHGFHALVCEVRIAHKLYASDSMLKRTS
jgi:hypothetical protein